MTSREEKLAQDFVKCKQQGARESRNLHKEIADLTDQLAENDKSIHELEKAKRNLVSERNELQAALEEAELAVENEKSKMLRIQFEMSQSKQDNIRNFYCKDKSAIIWNYENKKVTLGLLNDFLHLGAVYVIF